jgi:crotonobetainyl-CoA:carnitine CoA-transferase CaiB-like acyl-CoA transferase
MSSQIEGFSPEPSMPLAGVRVLDLSGPVGAYCGRLLADMGASVVKTEGSQGDPLRRTPPFAQTVDGESVSLSFAYYHANKVGLNLDVTEQDSLPQLIELGSLVDVVVMSSNWRRPVVGFDHDAGELSWANPGTIVCSITPFGLSGPYRHARATHMTSYAASGLMYTKGESDGAPQVVPGQQMFDHVGTHAAISILAALGNRPSVGGQLIDLSVHEVLTHSLFELFEYTSTSTIPQRGGPVPGGFIGVWQCADGPIELAVSSDKQWAGLVELLGAPAELTDPSWSSPLGRQENAQEIRSVLEPAIASISREAFVERGQALGVPCGLVNTVGQFTEDAHIDSRGFMVREEVGLGKATKVPGLPFQSNERLLHQYRIPAPFKVTTTVASVVSAWKRQPSARQSRPLSDIRVLSLGTAIVGGVSATTLAELGADVVKLESPKRPDNLRGLWRPSERVVHEPSGAETCAVFASCNRTVRSLSIDMKEPGAIDLFLGLVSVADVVLENFGPNTMRRWGVDYERLSAVNPGLIMLSMSGFGQSDGPRSHYRAYGSTAWSFVGMQAACGFGSGTHYDYISEAHGVLGVLAALAARERTGRGTHIDLALVEVAGAVTGPIIMDYTVNAVEPSRIENQVPGALFTEVVPCIGHDRWLAVELEEPSEWSLLCSIVGCEDTPHDPWLPSRDDHDRLAHHLTVWAAAKTPMQAMRQLQAAGLAACAVQDPEDIVRDPQHRARDFLLEMHHADLGTIEFAGPPHRLMTTPPQVRRPTPRLGEHTEEVLTEWLGMTTEEIQAVATNRNANT